jgi:hypothetical protein
VIDKLTPAGLNNLFDRRQLRHPQASKGATVAVALTTLSGYFTPTSRTGAGYATGAGPATAALLETIPPLHYELTSV